MNFKKASLFIFLAVFGSVFYFNVPVAKAFTASQLRVQIQALQQQIIQLQQQLTQVEEKPAVWCHDFNVNLRIGDSGSDVTALKAALGKENIAVRNLDTPADYFGDHTYSAVVEFQEKYATEVLASWGLVHGTGFVGPATLAKLNELYACVGEKKEGEEVKEKTEKKGEAEAEASFKMAVIEFEAEGQFDYGRAYYCCRRHPLSQEKECFFTNGHLKNCEFVDKSYSFLEVLNNPDGYFNVEITSGKRGSPHSLFYINDYFKKEAVRYGYNYNHDIYDITLLGPYKLDSDPPVRGRKTGLANEVIDFFNSEIAKREINISEYDIVAFIYLSDFQQNGGYPGFLSFASFPNIYISMETTNSEAYLDQKLEVFLHENAHNLRRLSDISSGYVQDKYTAPCPRGPYQSCCDIPEGIPEPNKDPLYPQNEACLMCGSIMLSEKGEGTSWNNLDSLRICSKTAEELGWVSPEEKEEKSITVFSPNGGEKWVVGETYEIKWESKGVDKLDIDLTVPGQYNLVAHIATNISASLGKYSWKVEGVDPRDDYKITISSAEGKMDESNGYFSIVEAEKKSITVIFPNGGERWAEGNTYNIKWESNGVDKVNIAYGDGKSWYIKTNHSAETGQYSWTIPEGIVESYSGFVTEGLSEFNTKIGIWDAADSNVFDKSDNYFTIAKKFIACTDSDGGKNYYTKGTVTYNGETNYVPDTPGGDTYTDRCGGLDAVSEFYCENNTLKAISFLCPPGCVCQDSACVEKQKPVEVNVSIADGNLIGVPTNKSYIAETLLEEINSQGGNCSRLYRWKAGAWETYRLGIPLNNFNMKLGEGYQLQCATSSVWRPQGNLISSPQLIQLGPSFHLISVPYFISPYAAEELLTDINNQGCSCSKISRKEQGTFVDHQLGSSLNNFEIKQGEGYLVNCESSSPYCQYLFPESASRLEKTGDQLASIGRAISQLVEKIKNLFGR